MSKQLITLVCSFACVAGLASLAKAQIYVAPRVARFAPAATVVQSSPTTVVAAKTVCRLPVTQVTNFAPAVSTPIFTTPTTTTTFFAPAPVATTAVPVTTFFAPAPVATTVAPVTTFFAPAPVATTAVPVTTFFTPRTTFFAPTTTFVGSTAVATPIVAARPAVLGTGIVGQPKVYVPGQPIRNALRWLTP